jgi:uncharacterized membrane protein YhaH (DUF805 family)
MPLKDLLFSFNGRIRRSQYWLAAIGLNVGYLVVMGTILVAMAMILRMDAQNEPPAVFWIVYGLSLIPLFWCSLAIAIKRWHDRDKSGVMVLIVLIPIVGPIWSLIECGFLDGTQGSNRYGPSPKGIGAAEKVF